MMQSLATPLNNGYKSPYNYASPITTTPVIPIATASPHHTINFNPSVQLNKPSRSLFDQPQAKTDQQYKPSPLIVQLTPVQNTKHYYKNVQKCEPFRAEVFADVYVHLDRLHESFDYFGPNLRTSHYLADHAVESAVHWGYRPVELPEDQPITALRLFNVDPKLKNSWHEYLDPSDPNEHSRQWNSRFPGQLHDPAEQLSFELNFELKGNAQEFLLNPVQLLNQFSKTETLGHADLELSLNEILQTESIQQQTMIIPHRITILEVKSNIPTPVNVQLRSAGLYTNGTRSEWFKTNTVTSTGLKALTVYPGTASLQERVAFEMAAIVRTAMFFRWINTDKSAVFNQLNPTKAGDFYQLDTPVVSEDSIVVASDDDAYVDAASPVASKCQPHHDEIHAKTFPSFICLDEFLRLKQMAMLEHLPETDVEINRVDGKFKVRCSLLDRLVNEKFDGPMDAQLHVMRVDQPVQLRLSLNKNELESTLKALHPDVNWPSAGSTTSQLISSNKAPTTNNVGVPTYSFVVRLKVQCARLESGTVGR